jgi:glycosyltransferase involved in cell wall biosynthesis
MQPAGLHVLKSVTVGMTRFTEPNWLVKEALESIRAQVRVSADVFFLDQQEDKELAVLCKNLSTQNIRFKYLTIPARGVSFARNKAIELAETRYILFYDPDEILEPLCMYYLTQTLGKGVAIAGGKILPIWHKKPLLIANNSVMQEFYSLLDLGDGVLETDRVFGGNFGIDLNTMGKGHLFQHSLGRQDGKLIGGEETALCERARADGFIVAYDGRAVIHHQILENRINYKWCLKRIFYAGYTRAIRGGKPSLINSERSIANYMFGVIISPVYATGFVSGKLTTILK